MADDVVFAEIVAELQLDDLQRIGSEVFEPVDGAAHREDSRQRFLIQSAELGFPAAQLDAAANFALGLNGFARDISQCEKWLAAAEKIVPSEAAALRLRLAHEV